ncbi:MAG: oligoendopeptidase F [Planctomycetia bacterium]|nr:oligoendopeptidase F [Planctomycetia bacterium]
MEKENVQTIPLRSEVAAEDKWNVESLYATIADWEKDFAQWEEQIPKYAEFRGKLGDGVDSVKKCLDFCFAMDRLGDKLGTYAFLRGSEDRGNSEMMALQGRFMNVVSRAGQEESFLTPELLALPEETLNGYLEAPQLAEYRLLLKRIVEEKPHTLSESEERLLAMQTEMLQTPSNAFDQLVDVDMKFGMMTGHHGETLELSHASFSSLLRGANRDVRRQAFTQYYEQFEAHKNTLAAIYAGNVHQDIFSARARNFASAREAALFDERIPTEVYDNLIETVHQYLPKLYEYFELRRRIMGIDEIHMFDTYVPMFQDAEVNIPWDKGVEMVLAAVKPLGAEYCDALRKGMTEDRWCDRYENRGKDSGAFSGGCYDSFPFVLMNYRADSLDSVFTLAHECGHSMHSWFSRKNQPYLYGDYKIFVAEVASTFNEELLLHHLLETQTDKRQRLNLINKAIDDIRATIFRQTMFAEFEREVHAAAEAGEPMTLDFFLGTYRKLLELYFGPKFALDECLSLEGLRIPHFYRAFYVYKYSIGLSAAIALSRRVLKGGEKELSDYLGFLSGGSSKEPLDLLLGAGVDMRQPAPIVAALDVFSGMVDTLKEMTD